MKKRILLPVFLTMLFAGCIGGPQPEILDEDKHVDYINPMPGGCFNIKDTYVVTIKNFGDDGKVLVKGMMLDSEGQVKDFLGTKEVSLRGGETREVTFRREGSFCGESETFKVKMMY